MQVLFWDTREGQSQEMVLHMSVQPILPLLPIKEEVLYVLRPHVILDQQQELASTGIEMEISCRDKLPRLGRVIWDGVLTLSSTSI